MEDELADGQDGVALPDHALENLRQRLGRVERGVVEQDDRPRRELRGDALADRRRVVVLPVESVDVPLIGSMPIERIAEMTWSSYSP